MEGGEAVGLCRGPPVAGFLLPVPRAGLAGLTGLSRLLGFNASSFARRNVRSGLENCVEIGNIVINTSMVSITTANLSLWHRLLEIAITAPCDPPMSRHSNLRLVFRSPQEIQSSKATLDEWINDQERTRALQTLSVRSLNCDPEDPTYQGLINSLIQLFKRGKSLLKNFQTLE